MRFALAALVLVAACGTDTPTSSLITEIPNGSYSGTFTESGAVKDLHINIRRPRFLWVQQSPRVERPGSVIGLTLFFDDDGTSVNVQIINGCITTPAIHVCP